VLISTRMLMAAREAAVERLFYGPTGRAQPLLRLARSPSTSCSRPSLT
jgi:hypothetical protein